MHVDYRQKEAQLREYNKMIDETQQQLQVLDDPEALEQLARERYLMHADGEDVYLIDE
ncbi:MAG: septum formation initiator family protein [Paludibacteraceae bacterium]|nr:septum formation initiator family protein [Paludibacteraceae bacterium]